MSLSRIRRTAGVIALQAFLVLGLSEVGVRVLARFDENLRQLSFNPRLTGSLNEVRTPAGLLASTRPGLRPFDDVSGFGTNSLGLRARELTGGGGAETTVVALGDSFTFAGKTAFRHHWPELFEAKVRERGRTGVEVVNLGYPAVGPRFELRMWQLVGRRLEPDLVIQAFYVGNDFLDGLGSTPLAAEPWEVVLERSALFRVVRNLYRYKREERHLLAALGSRKVLEAAHRSGGFELEGWQGEDRSHLPTFGPRLFDKIVAESMEVSLKEHNHRLEAAFSRCAEILLETRRDVESTGARYLLMILPAEFQIDRGVARAGAASEKRRLGEYEIGWPQQRFAVFCRNHDLDCLDLLPAFRRRARRTVLFRKRDTHWNRQGHALAVDQLLAWLDRSAAEPDGFSFD